MGWQARRESMSQKAKDENLKVPGALEGQALGTKSKGLVGGG